MLCVTTEVNTSYSITIIQIYLPEIGTPISIAEDDFLQIQMIMVNAAIEIVSAARALAFKHRSDCSERRPIFSLTTFEPSFRLIECSNPMDLKAA